MTSLSVIKLAVELNKAFGFEAQVKKMMKGCSVLSIEDELQEFMFSGTANQKTVKKEEKKEHKALYPLSKTQLGVYIDCMKIRTAHFTIFRQFSNFQNQSMHKSLPTAL